MIEDASHDGNFVGALNEALFTDLRANSVQGVNSQINLAKRQPNWALIAGLSATTSYGWARINLLWVSSDHRRTGLGRQLVQLCFDVGRTRQCNSAWLETSNPQAHSFYEAIGFDVFATLANGHDALPPLAHTRWFMRRALDL